MKDSIPSQSSAPPASPAMGFSPWQRLKGKNISYLTVPLLLMATVTEFVILATGWRYQQTVCLPSGMGVTFFGIGPIGATILAVELLKLPLAIWTASRRGWQKGAMVMFGLPLICLLTFQLVKDMAVYEMGVAMTPAHQFLERAMADETKMTKLEGELTAIEQKKAERQKKIADLVAEQEQAKANIDESLKHNDESRADAVTLTDYQKKELADVEAREATIIQQFDSDAAQVTKSIAELHQQRETELGRAGKWNAEEARLENEYQAKLAAYTNKKRTYEKDKAAYERASFVKRQFMKEPVDPGVAPERETNTILKPAALAAIDEQIKAKEAELEQINNKRRDRIAQVESDARQMRANFDQRSTVRREEADHKRDELLASQAALGTELKAEQKAIDEEVAAAVQKVDGIRAELDATRKDAEEAYVAREAAIRKTQVHRIATTVEIVRCLLRGEHPASIKATAKERGDVLTDQISMVRVWVYPVLAFIVAFLPTLLVEIGFSTIFQPERQRPAHRLGFFGRRLHWLYTRAGRMKILRAERQASEANAQLAARDRALATAKSAGAEALAEKEADLQKTQEALATATASHRELLKNREEAHAAELKSMESDHAAHLNVKEQEWVAKLAGMADSLNRSIIEKDALRDLQKSEIERQIQMRQNAWSDRLTQMRQELDTQRAAFETERTALLQTHHQKLLEVSEQSKEQVVQARRQAAEAELAAVDVSARLKHDLKAALQARDLVEAQLKQQAEAVSLKISETKEEVTREMEKTLRQEQLRADRLQSEFEKTLRQREDQFEHRLKQREHELSVAADARILEHQTRNEQEARRREADLARQLEAASAEVETRWKQDVLKREGAIEDRLKHQQEHLQAQADTRLAEVQTHADQELRRLRAQFERQLEAQLAEANARFRQDILQKDLAFQAELKQREQDWSRAAEAREATFREQWRVDSRARQEESERQAESRVRAAEIRFASEAQQKEELLLAKMRQSDQQWQSKLEAARAELKGETDEILRQRQAVAELGLRELGAQLRKEMQQKDDAAQAKARQREQELEAQFALRTEARHKEAQAQWEKESEEKLRATVEPLQKQLARTTKERDDAAKSLADYARQMQAMEKKLAEASRFFTSWRNGNGNGNGHGPGHGNGEEHLAPFGA